MLSVHHWEIGEWRKCRRHRDRPRGAAAGWAREYRPGGGRPRGGCVAAHSRVAASAAYGSPLPGDTKLAPPTPRMGDFMGTRIGDAGFLALAVLLGASERGFAAACNGRGVPEALAAAQAQCCPARNHGAYVSCAAHVTNELVKRGKLQASCKSLIFKAGCPAATTTTTTAAPRTTTTSITPVSTTTSTSAPVASTTTTPASSTTSTTMAGGPTTTSSTTPAPTTTTTPGATSTTTTSPAASPARTTTPPNSTNTTTPHSSTTSTNITRSTTTTPTTPPAPRTTPTPPPPATTPAACAASTTSPAAPAPPTRAPCPSRRSSALSSTTSTTMAGGPTTTSSTTPAPTTTTTPGATSTTTTTLGTGPVPPPREICGNCIDDDGNGLTDFEDPACCMQSQAFTMTVTRGLLRPRGVTTRLKRKSLLAKVGLADVNPLKQDVFVQIRPAGGTAVLCAKAPTDKFMKMHGAFKFWDRQHRVASAKGISDIRVQVRPDGSVRFSAVGKRVEFTTPQSGTLQVTVGFRDPATAETGNRCSTQTQAFRTGRQGQLLAP